MSKRTELQTVREPRPDRCETCRFWERSNSEERDEAEGNCHRMPPVGDNHFPEVLNSEWCGEWRGMGENKDKGIDDVKWSEFIGELSVRSRKALRKYNVTSFDQLLAVKDPAGTWAYFGETSVRDMVRTLKSFGIDAPIEWIRP